VKRAAIIVSLSAALVVGLFAGGALASHRPNTFCSQTGDFCQSTARNNNGVRVLLFRSFVHRGKVRVCVKAPTNARTCVKDRFTDGNNDDVFVTRLKWSTNFPNEGPGAYTVDWRQNGGSAGKKLGFHRN